MTDFEKLLNLPGHKPPGVGLYELFDLAGVLDTHYRLRVSHGETGFGTLVIKGLRPIEPWEFGGAELKIVGAEDWGPGYIKVIPDNGSNPFLIGTIVPTTYEKDGDELVESGLILGGVGRLSSWVDLQTDRDRPPFPREGHEELDEGIFSFIAGLVVLDPLEEGWDEDPLALSRANLQGRAC